MAMGWASTYSHGQEPSARGVPTGTSQAFGDVNQSEFLETNQLEHSLFQLKRKKKKRSTKSLSKYAMNSILQSSVMIVPFSRPPRAFPAFFWGT